MKFLPSNYFPKSEIKIFKGIVSFQFFLRIITGNIIRVNKLNHKETEGYLTICTLIFIPLLLFSCGTLKNQINSEAPKAFHHAIPDLPISRFTIPVKFLISAIEHEVNNHIGEVLFEDNNSLDDKITMTVVKSSRLTIHPKGKEVFFKLPIRIDLTYYPNPQKQDLKYTYCYELLVDFSSTFQIANDWELVPHTNYTGFEWVSKQKINPKEANIDFPKIIESGLTKQSDDMASRIDLFLRDHLDIKTIIEEAWNDMQDPIEAPASKVYYLPQSVSVTPIHSVGDHVELNMNVMLYTDIVANNKKYTVRKVPLPAPSVQDMVSDTGFVAHVSFKLGYGIIDSLLNSRIANHTFSFNEGKENISLTDFKSFANGDRIIIKAKLNGSKTGNIYVRAIPYLDTVNHLLKLRHVEFELETKNILAATAVWLMNGSIESKIQKAFEIKYGAKLAAAQSHINAKMQHVKVGDNVELRTFIDHINIHSVYIAHDFIELRSTAIGFMDVLLY